MWGLWGVPVNDRDRAELDHPTARVVLMGCSADCTKCGQHKPLSDFGLREMGDGVIRNQAQCSQCRGEH